MGGRNEPTAGILHAFQRQIIASKQLEIFLLKRIAGVTLQYPQEWNVIFKLPHQGLYLWCTPTVKQIVGMILLTAIANSTAFL